jgi:hypothetical protein
MKRYYFDLRDGDALSRDEEGIELPSIEAAQEEAVRALAGMAMDRTEAGSCLARDLAIEVRDDNRPVMRATFTFGIERLQ